MEKCIIKFFKDLNVYDEKMFDLIEKNTTIVDRNYDEIKDLVGCYIVNNKPKLLLPKIYSNRDLLIHIHEYTHALTMSDNEILPSMMEAFFVRLYIHDKNVINELIAKTNEEIEKSVSKKHTIAKRIKLKYLKKY